MVDLYLEGWRGGSRGKSGEKMSILYMACIWLYIYGIYMGSTLKPYEFYVEIEGLQWITIWG